MRRAHGEGSLLRRKGTKLWYAQYYKDGRQIRTSTKTAVRQKALGVLRKLMGDSERGLAPITDLKRIRYADLRSGLLANYLEKGNRSLMTQADGEETVPGLNALDQFFGFSKENPGPRITQITVDTGREFVKKRQQEDVGNAVINRSLACLRRMLRLAHEDGKIQAVPIIRLLKEPPARQGFLEQEKFWKLFSKCPKRLKPYVAFLYYCGGRKNEGGQIEWPQLDLKRGIVRLEVEQTKGKEIRDIPLPQFLIKMLRKIEPKTGKVFDTTNLRKEWTKACAAAGLGRIIEVPGKPYDPRYEGLTIHDLRRSAARNLLAVGVPETVIMKICGWKTRSVFIRYAIADTTDVRNAMRRLESRNGAKLVQSKTSKPRN